MNESEAIFNSRSIPMAPMLATEGERDLLDAIRELHVVSKNNAAKMGVDYQHSKHVDGEKRESFSKKITCMSPDTQALQIVLQINGKASSRDEMYGVHATIEFEEIRPVGQQVLAIASYSILRVKQERGAQSVFRQALQSLDGADPNNGELEVVRGGEMDEEDFQALVTSIDTVRRAILQAK